MHFEYMLRRLLIGGLLLAAACEAAPPAPTVVTTPLTVTAAPTVSGPATVTLAPPTATEPPIFTATPVPSLTPAAPSEAVAPFLSFPVAAGELIALTGASVIDGTGAPAHPGWTVLIQGDRILDAGADLPVPAGARVVDLAGRTLIPGLFDLHAHLYANDGRTLAGNFLAYPRLHLAGGVTTLFSPGEFAPEGAVALRDQIERGEAVGPQVLTAGPYFDGPGAYAWMPSLTTAAEMTAAFALWRDRLDAVKVYTHISEVQLAALIRAAHAEGLPVTGHLASVPAGRAITLGLDGLEHGLFSMSEFFPAQAHYTEQYCALARVDMASSEVAALVEAIVSHGVYVDPTMTVYQIELSDFEPTPADWDRYVTPLAVPNVLRFQRSIQLDNDTCLRRALANQQTLIRMLHDRGALVVTGTDAVIPMLLPGYALHRELANLVAAGLTPLEAIHAGTLVAATALHLDADRGSIAPGKRADLIVLAGDPSSDIAAVGTTVLVFKDGLPYDPAKLRASVEGMIGAP